MKLILLAVLSVLCGFGLHYPDYADRNAWDGYFSDTKEHFIREGERYLGFRYEHIPASVYLDFESGGDRKSFSADNSARKAVESLMLAELAEGKGRFMRDLINGVWYFSEKISWVHPQHAKRKLSHRSLGDPDNEIIGITSSFTGMDMAYAWHFFHKVWDTVDPSIGKAVRKSLDTHIFQPYLDESKTSQNWWLGMVPGVPIINWCPWINANCLLAFFLAGEDRDMIEAAVRRSTLSMKNYVDYICSDGGCDEGASYWNEAAGKVYDYACLLERASGGCVNPIDRERLKDMAEYLVNCLIGDGWVANYGDAYARNAMSDYDNCFSYRFGKYCGSEALVRLSLLQEVGYPGGDCFNILESLKCRKDMLRDRAEFEKAAGSPEKMEDILLSSLGDHWYPVNEMCVLRRGKWYLSTLAYNNYNGPSNDTHNHNDVGSFILFYDRMPVVIDMGKSTPTNGTYDAERYTFRHIRSISHNVPAINGFEQGQGAEFKASGAECRLGSGTVSADISGAYDKDAEAKWVRTFTLDAGKMSVSDDYVLRRRKGVTDVHFMVRGKVRTIGKGVLELDIRDYSGKRSGTIRMTYPRCLQLSIQEEDLSDPLFRKTWESDVNLLVFSLKDSAPSKGRLNFSFTPV